MSILVTQQAPDFTAPAVMPDGDIKEDFKLSDLRGKYVVLFFWPLNFSFVCPTEIIAHHKRVEQFKARNVKVVGVSIDSQFTHVAYRNTPVDEGGIGSVDFPIVADIRHEITQAYGIEHPDGVAMRASLMPHRRYSRSQSSKQLRHRCAERAYSALLGAPSSASTKRNQLPMSLSPRCCRAE